MTMIYVAAKDAKQVLFTDATAVAKGIGILLGCGHDHHFAVMLENTYHVIEMSEMAQACIERLWKED